MPQVSKFRRVLDDARRRNVDVKSKEMNIRRLPSTDVMESKIVEIQFEPFKCQLYKMVKDTQNFLYSVHKQR